MSEKGYSSQVIGQQWMETVFDPQTQGIANGRTRLLIVDGHSSHFTYELLSYATAHNIVVICLPPHTTHALQSELPCSCYDNAESTLLALDVLGFSQFKHYYAQILDDRARDGFGAMNKCAFLQAIEEPFNMAFTVENIKKSFEIVGLHPFNPNVIKTSKMAPSISTSIKDPLLTDEPSPVKAMKTAFTSLLDNSTLPVPPFPSLHLQPDTSPLTSAPPPMPSIAANNLSPQEVAQALLQRTSAAWIVNNSPVTSSVVFKPYCTPSVPSIRATMPPQTSTQSSPNDLTAENTALHEHINRLNHIIASQRVQLTLNSLAVRKLQHQLYEKEQRGQDRQRQHLFKGKAQIVTAPEFQKLVKDIQEKHHLEKERKEMRAEERKRKADANAALEDQKAQLIERYKEDMASYEDECAALAADGVPKKFWPKKPTHPTRGRKARQLQRMSLNSPPSPIPTTRPHRTAAPTDVIVDLGDDFEDSEYEDFDDEPDV
jgi:hypothetical protein